MISRISKKRKRLLLLCLVVVLLVLTLCGLAIVKFQVGPAIVHKKLSRGISDFWDGSVKVYDVDFNYSNTIHVAKVVLYDKEEREWLSAEGVNFTLGNWPSFQPVLTEVEIEEMNIQAHFVGGNVKIPLRHASMESAGLRGNGFGLEKLKIKNASVALARDRELKLFFDNLVLLAVKRAGAYDISVSRTAIEDSGMILIEGSVNPATSEVQLSFAAEHTAGTGETSMVFSLLGVPLLWRGEGRLKADGTIKGRLKEPESLWPQGTIVLNDWVISAKEHVIAQNLNTTVRLYKRRFDFDDLTAIVCKGRASGSFYAGINRPGPVEFGGQVSAIGIDMVELTDALAASKKFKKGKGSLNFNFTVQGKELETLRAEGLLFLDDADLWVLPVVPQVFRVIGLKYYDPLRMSDATAVFSMTGSTTTISRARIANRLVALEAESGGSINLQSGYIDVYVIAAPLEQLHTVLRNTPIVNLFIKLKDKLSRLHIKGYWTDSPAKIITKEPLKDIGEGTVDFMLGVVESGGQVTQKMFNTSKALFDGIKKKSPAEKKLVH